MVTCALGAGPGIATRRRTCTTAVRLALRPTVACRRWVAVVRRMDNQAVDRILVAVGESFIPSDLDREELCNALKFCATWHRVVTEYGSARLERERTRRLDMAAKSARRLAQLLAHDDTWSFIGKKLSPYDESPREAVLRLVKALDEALGSYVPLARRLGALGDDLTAYLTDRSPLEWLVGKHLPKLWSKHFGIKARISRSKDGTPDGPYIRFAESVLVELNITKSGQPYRRETLAKAFTDARAERSRKKASRQ